MGNGRGKRHAAAHGVWLARADTKAAAGLIRLYRWHAAQRLQGALVIIGAIAATGKALGDRIGLRRNKRLRLPHL